MKFRQHGKTRGEINYHRKSYWLVPIYVSCAVLMLSYTVFPLVRCSLSQPCYTSVPSSNHAVITALPLIVYYMYMNSLLPPRNNTVVRMGCVHPPAEVAGFLVDGVALIRRHVGPASRLLSHVPKNKLRLCINLQSKRCL